jgi:hypothetical protein
MTVLAGTILVIGIALTAARSGGRSLEGPLGVVAPQLVVARRGRKTRRRAP